MESHSSPKAKKKIPSEQMVLPNRYLDGTNGVIENVYDANQMQHHAQQMREKQFTKSATGPQHREVGGVIFGQQNSSGKGSGGSGHQQQQRFTNPTLTLEKMDEREPEEFKRSSSQNKDGHFKDTSSQGSEGSNALGNKEIKSILSKKSSGGSIGSSKSKSVAIDPEVVVFTIHNQQSSESENQPGKQESESSSSLDSSSQSSVPSNSPKAQQQHASSSQFGQIQQQQQNQRHGSMASVRISTVNKNMPPQQLPLSPNSQKLSQQAIASQNQNAVAAQSKGEVQKQKKEEPSNNQNNNTNSNNDRKHNLNSNSKNPAKSSCQCSIYQTSFRGGVERWEFPLLQLVC